MNSKNILRYFKNKGNYLCPYCKEKAISYGSKIKCWPLIEVRCPNCDVVIKHKKKYRIIDFTIIVIEFIVGMLLIEYGGDVFHGAAMVLLLLPSILYRSIAAVFTNLEYEEDAKHPKPYIEVQDEDDN